jgi:hypothetical protein
MNMKMFMDSDVVMVMCMHSDTGRDPDMEVDIKIQRFTVDIGYL